VEVKLPVRLVIAHMVAVTSGTRHHLAVLGFHVSDEERYQPCVVPVNAAFVALVDPAQQLPAHRLENLQVAFDGLLADLPHLGPQFPRELADVEPVPIGREHR
jgi:hypothetical protein